MTNQQTNSLYLPLHEWCVIVLFCVILLILAGFALGNQKRLPASLPSEPVSTTLQVKIVGQVVKPGVYRLPLKTTLKELLEQAQLLPSADLSQIKERRQLRDGQTIHIPERYWITIEIKGAVQQPGPLTVLSGTRYCELADQLEVLPEADLKSLRKKKSFLKEGSLIEVPVKTAKVKVKKDGKNKVKDNRLNRVN